MVLFRAMKPDDLCSRAPRLLGYLTPINDEVDNFYFFSPRFQQCSTWATISVLHYSNHLQFRIQSGSGESLVKLLRGAVSVYYGSRLRDRVTTDEGNEL